MIYLIPTKKGFGVELWGTYEDLESLYEVVGKFWNDENNLNKKGFENRDKLISGFSYEIRKAKEGNRLQKDSSHFTLEKQNYLGTQISWVHFLFSLSAIKHNMRYYETNKFDISYILLIEFWLAKAMYQFDEVGAIKLTKFIEDGLYGANEYIYHYMRSINLDYFLLGGGKKNFRELSNLLSRGVLFTEEYKAYEAFLKAEAKRLNCEVNDIEIDDDKVDYEKMEW
jgi:hypothetical protein